MRDIKKNKKNKESKESKGNKHPAVAVRRELAPYLLLGILTFIFCWLFVGRFGIFGSQVDWISQHSVIPEYFRQQFYETKQLFPEFALGLGAGQNIYHFSYYGLYSPVILLSYLLPFVKMSDYIMAASMVSLISAVLLLYRWLLKKGFSQRISVCTAALFLLAEPMIYHSYSQIMFVNYMPFLCLAFCGVDRYFEKRRSDLMILSIFLMILTSFYFSIGGMLVLVLYGIDQYLRINEQAGSKITAVRFLADGCRFLRPMVTAVLMSAVLLIPTALALTGNRDGKKTQALSALLLPKLRVMELVYSPYGIGLTTLVITVLLTGVCYRKWRERWLSLSCLVILTVPVFSYLLNGGLYIRDKVMIPFLPLLCYMTAYYLKQMEQGRLSVRRGLIPYLLTPVLIAAGEVEHLTDAISVKETTVLVLAESVLLLGGYLVYMRWKKILVLILPSLLLLAGYGTVFHAASTAAVSRDTYRELTDDAVGTAVREALNGEEGLFRLEQTGDTEALAANLNRVWDRRQYISSLYSSAYNEDYQKFRTEIFGLEQPFRNAMMQSASANPVFRRLMGVRYLISEEEIPGYELLQEGTQVNVYVDDGALPMIYATDQVISEKDYASLAFPYNQTVFLHYAVAGDGGSPEQNWKAKLLEETVRIEVPQTELQAATTVKLPLPSTGEEQETKAERVLYVRFEVENLSSSKDVAVWLDGIRNKLSADSHIYYNGNTTFTYVETLKEGQKEAELKLGKGSYQIRNLECYIGVLEKASESNQSGLQPDWAETKGNRIVGTIDVANDGALITSIPYDQNFEVRIDGEKVKTEKVNEAFLGAKIGSGIHQVEIVYHAPGVREGKLVSLFGLALFLGEGGVLHIRKNKFGKIN